MEEMEPVESTTPEERELDRKRAALAELENELIEREINLSTFEQEVATFKADYLRIVGRRYAALDDIKARIAAVRASQRPNDPSIQEEARRARETADDTAKQAGDDAPRGGPLPPFEPFIALKALYRSAARQMHPDLAATDVERTGRHEWMAKVNEAYKQQDEGALKSLLRTWAESPESVEGTGIASPTSATRRGFRRKSRILAPRPTRCASETGGFRVRGLPEPRVVPTYPLD